MLRHALLALLERRPFEQISVREICAEAGVHYGTFFRHSPSKEALLDRLAADQIEHIVALTLPTWEATDQEAAFWELCSYVDEHRALWAVLLNGGAGATMRQEWRSRAQLVAAERGPVGSWLPSELGTMLSTNMIADTLAWWLTQDRNEFTVDYIAGVLHRLLTTSTLANGWVPAASA